MPDALVNRPRDLPALEVCHAEVHEGGRHRHRHGIEPVASQRKVANEGGGVVSRMHVPWTTTMSGSTRLSTSGILVSASPTLSTIAEESPPATMVCSLAAMGQPSATTWRMDGVGVRRWAKE